MKDQSYGIIPFLRNNEKIEFLVIKHTAGHWSFPKGHPNKGETPIETATRELAEETGIIKCKIINSPKLETNYVFNNLGESVSKVVDYYLGEVEQKEVEISESEISDYIWGNFDKVLSILTHDGDKELLTVTNTFLLLQRIKLEIKNSKPLSTYIDALKEIAGKAYNDAEKLLPIEGVKIFIRHDPSSVIPELGVGGYAPDSNEVYISVDALHPNFIKTVIPNVYRTLLHELHHTARWRGPGYGETLLEALVTEGLADHFELEITGNPPQPWDKSLSKKDIRTLLSRAEKELDEEYSHNDWFYGSKKRKIPRWAGYSLGFNIVGEYLKDNPSKKPSSLYSSNANEYRKTTPVLYIMCGLPFSGKSTLAEGMYEKHGWKIVSIDHIKTKKGLRDVWKDMNVNDWEDIFAEAKNQTIEELCNGRSVIYDSTNHTKQSRDKLRKIAEECECTAKVVFVDVPLKTAESRWMANKDSNKRMDLPEWAFQAVIRDWESPDENEY